MTTSPEVLNSIENEGMYQFELPEGTMERHSKRLLVAGDNGEVTTEYTAQEMGDTEFDILNYPGMAEVLVKDTPDRDLFISAIKIAIDLHHVEEVALSTSTGSEEVLARAKAYVQQQFPHLKVRTIHIDDAKQESKTVRVINACCMDGRLGHANDAHMTEGLNEDVYDALNFPGIALALAGDQPGRELFERAIEKLIREHGTEELMITTHQDCGAAGGSKKFGSLEKEKEYHLGVLDRAASFVEQRFPGLKVHTAYVQFTGDTVRFERTDNEEADEEEAA